MVDLLEAGGVSWAAYAEHLPYDGFNGTESSSKNYVTPGASDYAYYMRKHVPPMLYDSVKTVPSRAARRRPVMNGVAGGRPKSCIVDRTAETWSTR